MAGIGIKIDGEAALRAALRALPVKIENQVLAKALRAGGNEFRRAIRAATPVRAKPAGPIDGGKRSRRPGNLRRSWRVTIKREQQYIVAYVHPGASGYYALFVEKGTATMNARPFMAAAAQAAASAANAKMAETARAELAKTVLGQGVLAQLASG